jgi:hypothetical protein
MKAIITVKYDVHTNVELGHKKRNVVITMRHDNTKQ